VLVTGAAGEIGSVTTAYLQSLGIPVTALSISYPSGMEADRVIVGDATSPDDVAAALNGVDAVVHLAAIPHPSLASPYEVYRTNVNATFNVLSQAGQRGVQRAVIASSINAFGVPMNRHAVMPAYFPLDEDLPADIDDAYSLSKLADEATMRMIWRRWGMDVMAFRFPLVKQRSVLLEVAERYRGDPTLGVREGWSYLDTRDAVRAIHLALTESFSGAHVVGLSAPDTLIEKPTSELLARYAPDVPLSKPVRGFGTLVDNSRARTLIAFEARHSIHGPGTSTPVTTTSEDYQDA